MGTKSEMDRRPCLVGTLGMFIIDQFKFEDIQTGEDLGDRGLGSQIGGGGTYFAIGARMWLPPSEVLMIVDRGPDFTAREQEKMDQYAQGSSQSHSHSLWRYRNRKEGTTRAVNIYRGQERGFAYLTPKLRLDPRDLLSEIFATYPIYIHCICSPDRANDICDEIDSQKERWYIGKRPIIVWEPIPDSATPENLRQCLQVMGRIDVISPNHEEAANFLSVDKARIKGHDARTCIKELLLDRFYSEASIAKVRKAPTICIRSGALGALVAKSQSESMWVEAYHTKEEEVDKVKDVTGAGNAWLGGWVGGLAISAERRRKQGSPRQDIDWTLEELHQAALMGSVSASFVVEQQGLPDFHIDSHGVEYWNKEEVKTRMLRLQHR